MGEGAPSMSLGSSPATLKPVHRNLPKTLRDLERYCPHRPCEQNNKGRRKRKTVGKSVKLGFAGGAAHRVGNIGNRLERLGVFLHGGCDLFIGVHDRRMVPTPESGSDLGK